MKTLKVYTKESFFTYDNLYVNYQFERKENDVLVIFKVDNISGDESICAVFRQWEYLEIEEYENE